MSTSGKCLCGQVTFTLPKPVSFACCCHCNSCRAFTGNYSAIGGGDGLSYAWSENAVKGPIKYYADSRGVERGFCTECGSSLFQRHPTNHGGYCFVMLAALEGDPGIKADNRHVFTQEAGLYYTAPK